MNDKEDIEELINISFEYNITSEMLGVIY